MSSGAQQPDRVVVLRALGLGDALTGVPALRGLRRRYPGATLTLLAPAAIGAWFQDLALVDEVVPVAGLGPVPALDARGAVAVNLHGRGPQSHALLLGLNPARLVAFRAAGHPDGPEWDPQEHEVDRWCRLVRADGGECGRADLRLELGAAGPGEHVVVHPGAAFASRRWPTERWVVVVRELLAEGLPVVLTGSGAEQRTCAEIASRAPGARDLSGRSTIADLATVVASARLLICGDTGVAHLATAAGTPSVLLFGPMSPRLWGPVVDPERHIVIWHGSERCPGDPHGTQPDGALLAIEPDEVLKTAREQLL